MWRLFNECLCCHDLCSGRTRSALFLNVGKVKKSKCVPRRPFFQWNPLKRKLSKPSTNYEEIKLKPLTGIDDPNFSEYLKQSAFDVEKQKEGFKNFMRECKRFYAEEIATFSFRNFGNEEIPDPRAKIKIVHKFETPEDLKDCAVMTDSSFLKGFSSASLRLTENETAVFSGNICTDLPKTGDIQVAGYANVQCPKQRRAFFRVKPYDWSDYTHLVLRVRGDGRTYMVMLHSPKTYDEANYQQFVSPLYTRGGPYWQIAKIPFAHFYFIRKGKISDRQDGIVPLHNIVNVSITAGAFDGPFKLEIDYIGLEFKEFQKLTSPFEEYAKKQVKRVDNIEY